MTWEGQIQATQLRNSYDFKKTIYRKSHQSFPIVMSDMVFGSLDIFKLFKRSLKRRLNFDGIESFKQCLLSRSTLLCNISGEITFCNAAPLDTHCSRATKIPLVTLSIAILHVQKPSV